MYLPDFFKFLWMIILKDTTKWSDNKRIHLCYLTWELLFSIKPNLAHFTILNNLLKITSFVTSQQLYIQS